MRAQKLIFFHFFQMAVSAPNFAFLDEKIPDKIKIFFTIFQQTKNFGGSVQ